MSSERKRSFISFISFKELPSNLITSLGVVLDALIRPHPLLKFILKTIYGNFFTIKTALICQIFQHMVNFVSSVTVIFNSGVEDDIGNL